jgi:cobalt/nickel transport system permease protein
LIHVDFEEHIEGNSILHKLDGRVKIIIVLVAVFCTVALSHWEMALIVFITCAGLVALSKAPFKIYLKRLLYPSYIIIFVSIIQPFTYGSKVAAVVPWLSLPIYQEGISFAILIFTRCLAAVAILNLLILVTPMTDLLDSLAWFKVPSSIIDTMMLMFRYISLISEESTRMYRAQESRCGHSRSVSYLKKIRNFGTIAGGLVVRSFDRALKVGDAMASRGYTGNYRIFTYQRKQMPRRDLLVGTLLVSANIFLVLADILFL